MAGNGERAVDRVVLLTPLQQRVMGMLLKGMRRSEVARALRHEDGRAYSPQHVGNISNTPQFKRAYEAARREAYEATIRDVAQDRRPIVERLAELANEAMDVLERRLRAGEDARGQLEAALSVLDRAGFKAVDKQIVQTVNLTGRFSERVEEALMLMGRVQDGERAGQAALPASTGEE